ncbi:hypothetical protein BDA99DRAFT_509966 [Phascolomyces articulosus]|uniref:Uncharacterized protein n=1 Tax=Phascolomyces articulosus TaxID=60185 RepID=A0AAD5KA54_9FUNG|nr:hypothetical protein BDA99DRAFT_509966 [Phascolomyces articulosus]
MESHPSRCYKINLCVIGERGSVAAHDKSKIPSWSRSPAFLFLSKTYTHIDIYTIHIAHSLFAPVNRWWMLSLSLSLPLPAPLGSVSPGVCGLEGGQIKVYACISFFCVILLFSFSPPRLAGPSDVFFSFSFFPPSFNYLELSSLVPLLLSLLLSSSQLYFIFYSSMLKSIFFFVL